MNKYNIIYMIVSRNITYWKMICSDQKYKIQKRRIYYTEHKKLYIQMWSYFMCVCLLFPHVLLKSKFVDQMYSDYTLYDL